MKTHNISFYGEISKNHQIPASLPLAVVFIFGTYILWIMYNNHQRMLMTFTFSLHIYALAGVSTLFLAHLYEVQGELLQSPRFSASASAFPSHCDKVLCSSFPKVHFDSHSSESIHIWTICTLEGQLSFHIS